MAMLRNKEVSILRVATDIDPSTFQVRYKDGETEYAKMHELHFTHDEAKIFVHPQMPQINYIEDAKPEPVEVKVSHKKK